MARRTTWGTLLAIISMLLIAAPALGGGWAVVTLDALPSEPAAGKTISFGFMVRQHGDKPVDVHTWEDGEMPTFFATNTETGEKIQFTARKEGDLGHYVVDVAFPSAGDWEIEIVPTPFAGTHLGTLTVLPAASQTSQQNTSAAWALQPATLRWIGGALIVLAIIAALARPRMVGRPVLRSR